MNGLKSLDPVRGHWISELTFLEWLECADLIPRHCLPKKISVQVLRDRIQACEGALWEATRGINIAYGIEFEKHCTNRHLDELNKDILQI